MRKKMMYPHGPMECFLQPGDELSVYTSVIGEDSGYIEATVRGFTLGPQGQRLAVLHAHPSPNDGEWPDGQEWFSLCDALPPFSSDLSKPWGPPLTLEYLEAPWDEGNTEPPQRHWVSGATIVSIKRP